jgi:hypothetical protein
MPTVRDATPLAARGGAAAPLAALRRRLAGGDVRLQPGEVLGRQARDGAPAEQRLDVPLDAAPVHGQGGHFTRPAASAR